MISIIIPIYNAEKYLSQCIDSILADRGVELEVILVNDGSTDSSLEICKKYESDYSDIVKVFSKENGGVSSARNYGIDMARGEYITFVDADDTLTKDALSGFKMVMEKKSLDMATFGIWGFKENGVISKITPPSVVISTTKELANEYVAIEKSEALNSMSAKLYKTSIIKENNIRFNENISILEDTSFVYSYLKHCTQMVFSGICTYLYRQDNPCTLVSAYNENAHEAVEYELMQSKWILDTPLDEKGRDFYYIKRFTRAINFIYRIYRNKSLRGKEKKQALKRFLDNKGVCQIINEVNSKKLKFNKLILSMLKKKAIGLLHLVFSIFIKKK